MFNYSGIEDEKAHLIEAALFSKGFLSVGDVVSIFNITRKDDISKLYSIALDREKFMNEVHNKVQLIIDKEKKDGSTRTN